VGGNTITRHWRLFGTNHRHRRLKKARPLASHDHKRGVRCCVLATAWHDQNRSAGCLCDGSGHHREPQRHCRSRNSSAQTARSLATLTGAVQQHAIDRLEPPKEDFHRYGKRRTTLILNDRLLQKGRRRTGSRPWLEAISFGQRSKRSSRSYHGLDYHPGK